MSHDRDNPSRFAPRQLIIAHAALSDPAVGKLLHEQKSAREGFARAFARTGNSDLKLDAWRFVREADGRYRASLPGRDFTLDLMLTPTQPPMLQGENGFSRKGPSSCPRVSGARRAPAPAIRLPSRCAPGQ